MKTHDYYKPLLSPEEFEVIMKEFNRAWKCWPLAGSAWPTQKRFLNNKIKSLYRPEDYPTVRDHLKDVWRVFSVITEYTDVHTREISADWPYQRSLLRRILVSRKF